MVAVFLLTRKQPLEVVSLVRRTSALRRNSLRETEGCPGNGVVVDEPCPPLVEFVLHIRDWNQRADHDIIKVDEVREIKYCRC